ncbi:MAG: GGDEF domain-containing protein [Oscillibacter sp.]|nr:GGDEF domain-containing protein [Oscillibacter sp.]
MLNYYSTIIMICWMSLGVLCILVLENNRLPKKKKHILYLTYALTALAAFAEWLGLQLNGNVSLSKWPLRVVKCADYILTPLAGGLIVGQLQRRSIWLRLIGWVLAGNTLFQIVSVFTGWMVNIDETNHYSHGRFYRLYICTYLTVTMLIILEFMSYGRSFRRRNQVSLYAILILALSGTAFQEILGMEYRTAYLSLTLAMAMMFIHTSEFAQLKADDHILQQQIQITTDALTGALNRYAYSQALRSMDEEGQLPDNLTVFSIDINELKTINDTMGHEAGDELICGAAGCIQRAMKEWGDCYRTGGDEFVVLARMRRGDEQEALARLKRETGAWSGKKVKSLRLAVGYANAAENPGVSSQKLVSVADMAMYAQKAAYYKETGKDRRGRH